MWSLEKQITEATKKVAKLEKENAELRCKHKVSESRSSSQHRAILVEGLADTGLTTEEAEIAADRKILVEGFIGIGLSKEEAEIAAGRTVSENKSDEKESPMVESYMRLGLTKEAARIAASPSCRRPIFARG